MGKRRTRGCRQLLINGVFRYCFKHHLDSARCARYNASTCQRFSRRTYYKLEGSDHSADKFDIQEEKLSKPDDVTTTSTPLGSASECAFKTSLQACSASELDTDQEKSSNPADVTTTSTLGLASLRACSASKFDIDQDEELSKPDDVTTSTLGSDQVVQSCDSSTTSANR